MYLNREDIIRMAREVGNALDFGSVDNWIRDDDLEPFLIRFASLVADAEREACAKLCEDLTAWHSKTVIAALDSAAENIRARSLDVHN
jgi:hypothetical protein